MDLRDLVSGDLVVGGLPLVPEREARQQDGAGFPAGIAEALAAELGADEEDPIFAEIDAAEGEGDARSHTPTT